VFQHYTGVIDQIHNKSHAAWTADSPSEHFEGATVWAKLLSEEYLYRKY